jgi:hypothetical protein
VPLRRAVTSVDTRDPVLTFLVHHYEPRNSPIVPIGIHRTNLVTQKRHMLGKYCLKESADVENLLDDGTLRSAKESYLGIISSISYLVSVIPRAQHSAWNFAAPWLGSFFSNQTRYMSRSDPDG